jgi:hypothetical protein
MSLDGAIKALREVTETLQAAREADKREWQEVVRNANSLARSLAAEELEAAQAKADNYRAWAWGTALTTAVFFVAFVIALAYV